MCYSWYYLQEENHNKEGFCDIFTPLFVHKPRLSKLKPQQILVPNAPSIVVLYLSPQSQVVLGLFVEPVLPCFVYQIR